MATKGRNLFTILGPGILMAAAAIGASHLVQSTRAGADFGFQLLWLALLANVLKYPFFEFAQRYSASTGETLLHGYRRLGLPYVIAFLCISCVTMVTSISALTFVTAGLAENLFGWSLGKYSAVWWSLIVIVVCNGVLFLGKYRALDSVTKVIVAILGLTTIIAVIAAFAGRAPLPAGFESPSPWTLTSLYFLLALMGWMPGPIEISAWPTVWIKERYEQTGYKPTVREALVDLNTGYIATIVLAAAFLSLGALVMHGSGQQFENSGVKFAGQLVDLFKNSIGQWSGPVVAIAAFTCMFSTTLTCLDGYPRSNATAAVLSAGGSESKVKAVFWVMNLFTCIATLAVVAFLTSSLKTLVDVATIVAFLAAPLFGFLNLRLITSRHTPSQHRPGMWLLALAWAGLVFLVAFSAVFVVVIVLERAKLIG